MQIQTMRNLLLGSILGVSTLAMVGWTSAGATVLVEDTGWQYDQVNTAGSPSSFSPWTLTVLPGDSQGVFSLSDGFIAGDTYTATLNGSGPFNSVFAILFSNFDMVPNNFGPAASFFAADFLDPSFAHLQIFIPTGAYTISITGNGSSGLPAGFGVRFDSVPQRPVPEPMTLVLFGAGVAGLGAMRRRRKAKA